MMRMTASHAQQMLAMNLDVGRSKEPAEGPGPTRQLLIWRISPEAACVPSSETGLLPDGVEWRAQRETI